MLRLPLTPLCPLLTENPHDGSDRADAQGDNEERPKHNAGEEGKPVPTSIAADAQDNSEALNLAVTVTRADGLSVTAARHTFRMPKNSPTQHRYVRLSVLDYANERTVLASAATSAVPGNKPDCGWGNDERGETLHLVVDKVVPGTNDGEEEMPLQSSRERKFLLEVEAWKRTTETGGDDILLGRGQTLVGHAGLLEADESEARWVVLSLDDKPKGRVEISVSALTDTKASDATIQLETLGQEMDLEQDEQKEAVSDGDTSKRDDDDERELGVGGEGGSEGNTHRKEGSTDAPKETSPKARTTKWGLPSMPDIKSTLNASLSRATNMIAKQTETPTNNEKQTEASMNNESDAESEDGASKEGTIGEGVPKGDGERQSVIGDEAPRQAISKISSLGKTASHGMPGMLGARHGMLSLKESLQARLTGTSGKLRTEYESGQDGVMPERQSEDVGAHHESGAGQDPVNNDNTPVLSYSSLTRDRGQGASLITVTGRQAFDLKEEQAELENIFTDADSLRNLSADTPERKQSSREPSKGGSLGEDSRRADRRESRSRAGSMSPLRSLLQDVTADQADQDANDNEEERHGNSEEEQQPKEEEEVEDGEGKDDHEHVGDNATGSRHARWSPAHTLSVPVVASSVKEVAARVKSSLSSPKISGSLKSFRWNRHNEDSFTNDPSPRSPHRASTDDDTKGITPKTLTGALEVDETGSDDKGEGSFGSGTSQSPPSAAATILVTIFRASDLPEISAKRMFGRTKKDGAQDPYVLLHLHGCEAVTSTAQREGQECTWGSGDEGEAVEISIPVSKVPDAGLESSKLIIELRNKATDVREKDALLSSTEIPLMDWLGKKATWADLESTSSAGGRVKLSVALTERGTTPTVSNFDLHKAPMDLVSGNTSATTEIVAVGKDAGPVNTTSTKVSSDIAGAFQDLDHNPQPSLDEHGGLEVMAERGPEDGSIDDTLRASSGTSKGRRVRKESKADASRRNLRLLPSDENSQKASDQEQGDSHAVSGPLPGQPKTGDEVVLLQESAGNEATAATSSHDIGPEHDEGGALLPATDVMEAADDRGGGVAGVESTLVEDKINITVVVLEADSLAISLSKNAFGRPKKNATQDPYVVLRMCGGREATSAVVEGGSKCQWSGTAGEAVCLAVSSANLKAAGWGQAEVEGPHLTVEVWNQESPSRQGDIFIGSAYVKLKDRLGSGPSWVDLHRRKNNRGRVMIDVSCPILQQSSSDTSQKVELDTKQPSVKGNLLEVLEKTEDTRRTSSELLEGGGREAQTNRPKQDEKTKQEQDDVSNLDITTNRREPAHRSSQLLSDALNKEDRPIQEGEENRLLSDASVEPVGQGTAADSSPSLVDPDDSLESPALPRKERQNKTPNAQEEGMGDGIDENSNVATPGVADSHAAVNGQSARFSQEVDTEQIEHIINGSTAGSADSRIVTRAKNVGPFPEIEKKTTDGDIHCLSRQLVGGRAAALDLTTSDPITDPRFFPGKKQEPTRVESLTTNITPVCDHSDPESTESLQPGSEHGSQPARLDDDECGDGCTRALDQGQRSRSKSLKASDELHSSGAVSGVSSGGLDGISDGGLQASKSAASDDPRSSAQPHSIKQDEEFPAQQKLENKLGVTALDHSPANAVTQTQTEKRLGRAREIARRRRKIISGCETVGRRGRINAPPGVQTTDSSSIVTPEHTRAVITIQGACRGRTARRCLRARQRAAIKIQAACRGYVSRRECTGLRARTRRANVEEKRARQRRSRMAATQKVCVCVFSVRSRR